MRGLNSLDFLVIVAYLVGVTLLGIWVGRRQRDANDYFVAEMKNVFGFDYTAATIPTVAKNGLDEKTEKTLIDAWDHFKEKAKDLTDFDVKPVAAKKPIRKAVVTPPPVSLDPVGASDSDEVTLAAMTTQQKPVKAPKKMTVSDLDKMALAAARAKQKSKDAA